MIKLEPQLQERLTNFTRLLATTLIHAIFLGFWMLIKVTIGKIISYFALAGIDATVLVGFRIVFSYTTLIIVICYMIKDILTILFDVISSIKRGLRYNDEKLNL